jgi:hypothetical protein
MNAAAFAEHLSASHADFRRDAECILAEEARKRIDSWAVR